MKPILFNLFGLNIYSYGFMMAIGIIFGYFLLEKRRKIRGYDEDSIFNLTILTVILGILGGKVLYIVVEFKNIIKNPSYFLKFSSGFVVYGAIIGGALGIIIYSIKKKWDVLAILDLVTPSIPLGQGFGRIGCFLAGCCYGKETTSIIGVEFKNSPFAPSGIIVHPTQIYSSIFDFCLTMFLLWYDKKQRKNGSIFYMYIMLYSVGRFLIEFLRSDDRGSVGVLSTSQFISIIIFLICIVLFNIKRFRKN